MASFTVPTTAIYRSTDGKESRYFIAGAKISQLEALRFGMSGAASDDPIYPRQWTVRHELVAPDNDGALKITSAALQANSARRTIRFYRGYTGGSIPFNWVQGTWFTEDGAMHTNAWVVISGSMTTTLEAFGPDDYKMNYPTSEPFMLGLYSDVVGPTLVVRASAGGPSAYNAAFMDLSGNHTLSIEVDGKLSWGGGARGAEDTNLYRSAANVLKTDDSLHVSLDFKHLGSNLGFYGAAVAAKPTISGSRGANAALASLLSALATLGLVTDSTT